MKNFFIVLAVIILIGIGAYFFIQGSRVSVDSPKDQEVTDVVPVEKENDTDQLVVEIPEVDETKTVIGKSVDGRDITAFHYGSGDKEILFVGGIHGGYSWNTALVAYELMDYLDSPDMIPQGVKVTVIPVLNPDGLFETIGGEGRFTEAAVPDSQEKKVAGRFNANEVDLNRNFDCDWNETATWQNKTVSGGSAAFSESESQAIRDYVDSRDLASVVVWYSAAGGVFASNCHNGVLPETTEITNVYADASGYKAYQEFDFYDITGDMVNWLASKNIPAISVLLTTHEVVEWSKNQKGIEALLEYYAE